MLIRSSFFQVVILLLVVLISLCSEGREVITLTDENFNRSIEESHHTMWIVEFYAPWCHHCKKLVKVLEEFSSVVANSSVAVAKVDATVSKAIAKEHDVKKYPTIKYFINKKWKQYEGGRSLEELASFTAKLLGPSVVTIQSLSELRDHDVSFVLSTKGDSSDDSLVESFYQLSQEYQGHAVFSRIVSTDHTDFQIAALYNGNVYRTLMSAESAVENTPALKSFILKFIHPLMNKFDNSNFKRLASLDKPMIIAVVDYSKSVSEKYIKDFSDVIASLPSELQEFAVFGHLDGIKWRKFLRKYHATPFSILILDIVNDQYFPGGGDIIDDSLRHSLQSLRDGNLEMIEAVEKTLIARMWYKLNEYYPWSLLCLFPVLFGAFLFLMPMPKEKKE